MKRFIRTRDERGFTLIELAIVLVIIGIILGAVLKGQDLIANARAKRLATWVKEWETLNWNNLDRKGRFAGDSDKDGIIGNETTPVTYSSEITTAKGFRDVPSTSLNLGSQTWYLMMGHDSNKDNKNVILLTDSRSSTAALAVDQLVYVEGVDNSIDGEADATAGVVRGVTSATFDSTETSIVKSISQTTAADWGTVDKGLVYYFDRNAD